MIRRLAWESEFFGFDIAQLELEGPAPDLTAVDRSRDDIAELRELAAELFVDSRFFHRVSPLDDICLVLARRGPATAFITLRHRADNHHRAYRRAEERAAHRRGVGDHGCRARMVGRARRKVDRCEYARQEPGSTESLHHQRWPTTPNGHLVLPP